MATTADRALAAPEKTNTSQQTPLCEHHNKLDHHMDIGRHAVWEPPTHHGYASILSSISQTWS